MATFTFKRDTLFTAALQQRPTISIGNRGATSFKPDLQEVWEGVQADRAEMLDQVRGLQLAAQLLMQGESRRLAALFTDDDRVELLAAAAGRVADRIGVLDEEIGIAGVRVPMVKKTEALLNGRITDGARQAAGLVKVALADERGQLLAGVEPVEVDPSGYYAIIVPADVAASLGPDRKLGLLLMHEEVRVPAPVAPLMVGSGVIQVQDVSLSGELLDRLKLRPVFGVGPSGAAPRVRTTTSKGAGRQSAAQARRSSGPKKRDG
jgi:hypothetical protein